MICSCCPNKEPEGPLIYNVDPFLCLFTRDELYSSILPVVKLFIVIPVLLLITELLMKDESFELILICPNVAFRVVI